MSYPILTCIEYGAEAKCIGYRFAPGVPSLNTSMGCHHIYIYECSEGHRFENDLSEFMEKGEE